MSDKITIEWETSDGYAGGRRPHSFQIDPEDFFGLTEVQLQRELEAAVQEDFDQKVTYACDVSEVMEQIRQAEHEAESREEDEE